MEKKECIYCGEKVIHEKRKTNICLDCIVKVLVNKDILSTVVNNKKMIRE